MKDAITNEILSEEEIMKNGLTHLAEACGFFYEIETDEGKALAFMVDSALRYAQAICNGRDPRLSEEFVTTSEMETIEDRITQ